MFVIYIAVIKTLLIPRVNVRFRDRVHTTVTSY